MQVCRGLEFDITVDNDMPIMVGDFVTLSCHGKNLELTTIFQFDRLDDVGAPFKIGLNGKKDDNIASLKRYQMTIDTEEHVFTVNITGWYSAYSNNISSLDNDDW